MSLNLRFLVPILGLLLAKTSIALEPEQVLGEYWKDPLFGEAAAGLTVQVEVLNNKLWPETISVPTGVNIRFVVTNKTEEIHLLAMTADLESLTSDASFKKFLNDEVYHTKLKPVVSGQHQHASTNVDDARSMVKTLDERPTVIVRPREFKEVLVRFSEPNELLLFCALDDHLEAGYSSVLTIQ